MPLGATIDEFKLVTCAAETAAREVATLMRTRDVGMVIIVDESGRPLGLVTDRDLTLRLLAEEQSPETPVIDLMTDRVRTVRASDSLTDVMKVMREEGVRRVPVVDEAGRITAVLSFGDIFRLLTRELDELAALTPPDLKVSPEAA